MIGNLKKYIDKVSFMEHIDAKLRQNEPMIIDSFVSNKCNLKCRHCYFGDARPISSAASDVYKRQAHIRVGFFGKMEKFS